MASTFSTLLTLEKLTQGEQDNTWGDKTTATLSKIEQAIAGRLGITLASSNYTLTAVNGGDGSGSTNPAPMILDLSGTLTANVNVIIPNVSKLYVVKNGTSGAYTAGVKTTSGSALSIPQGETYLVWCNGSNVVATISALASGTIALATNALQLGGVVAASYAQKAVKNTWTYPQVVEGDAITLTAGEWTPNADEHTTMYLAQAAADDDITIANPSGTPVHGQIMTFCLEQHASTLRSLTWGSKYIFTDDTNLNITQTLDAVDIFTAQYNSNLDRWLVAGVAQNFPRS